MTTHNTHDDKIDADASVVESASAPEIISTTSASIPEIDATAAPSSPEQTSATESTEVYDAPSLQTNEQVTLAEEAVPNGDLSSSLPFSQTLEAPSSKIEEADTLAEQTVQSPSVEIFSSSSAQVDLLTPLTSEANPEPAVPFTEETLSENVVLPVTTETELVAEEPASILDASSPASDALLAITTEVIKPVEHPTEESQPVSQETETGPYSIEESSTRAEEATFPYASILSFAEPKSAEVRSFSDFIEEFRQAEALQETHVDFSLLTPTVQDLEVPSEIFEAPTHDAIFLQNASSSPELSNAVNKAKQEEAVQKKEVEPVITPEEKPITEKQEIKPDLISGQLTPTPITRVSPLLRPASRLRIPRHASRHHRDEPLQEPLPTESVLTPPIVAPAPVEPQKSAEPIAESSTTGEQPRPARRYRFDRPSAAANVSPRASAPAPSANVSPVVPQRPEEIREKENIQSRGAALPSFVRPEPSLPEPIVHEEKQQPEPVSLPIARNAANAYVPEQVRPIQELPEPLIANPEPNENGRRRHQQERSQKEQPMANTIQSVPVPVEIVVPVQLAPPEPIVAPEDLPPLEYADLQKANPRRRRRHRNAPVGVNGAVQSTPEAPAAILPVPLQNIPLPAPAPVANVPIAPAAQRNLDNQFSIVSGYTVSQMNQGNEVTGPFMGPEPSPARGSGVVSRDGRSTRAEMQRTPVYPPAIRTTHEAGPSASSMNHFANVVSQSIQQSIQLQTDRMVTELRRANQAPTSVSVSLPPFPSTERVGVFVDVANLLYSARTLRIAVDFGKLLDFLRGNRRLVRAHAYCPTSPQAGDEQMFLQAVKGLGYRITTKNYKTFSSGAKKADLDLDLCMDVVRLVDGRAVDCIVLVSGDSDFMPMLDYCSDHGVRVEVAAFDEAMSATLRQSCDLFVNLSMLEEIRS